MMLNIKLEQVS